MPREPDVKRAVSFIDGQNLFRHAKDAFGHDDTVALSGHADEFVAATVYSRSLR